MKFEMEAEHEAFSKGNQKLETYEKTYMPAKICNCSSYEQQLKVYEEQLKEKDAVIAELKGVIKTLSKMMR